MMRFCLATTVIVGLIVSAVSITPLKAAEPDPAQLYNANCAACHGGDRLGAIGPALLPENLRRLRSKSATGVITKGRPSTQMPPFEEILNADEIQTLVKYIFTPLDRVPVWGKAETEASRIIHIDPAILPDKPTHSSDQMNLFTVVEAGDHHVTILDGDSFESIWRFESRFALHGGAKYSPDGRFVYLGSRDGWVSKYDLYSLQIVAEVRAGINTRNIAISGDGKYVAVGNTLPNSLVFLNADDLSVVKYIEVKGKDGTPSRVSAVYTAPPRMSFIAALKDVTEIWELSYDPEAEPIYGNFVHSYRKDHVEAVIVDTQPFGVKRIEVGDYLDDFFFDQAYTDVMGAARNAKKGMVFNLDARRKIADLELTSMPHLGSGITFVYQGRQVMATPHLKEGMISVIDMDNWKTVKKIKTLGPGFFMRSHDNTPYAWADVFFGPHKDAMHVIDKRTLEIVKTLRPEPGKVAAHVEFTQDGKFALVSIWDKEGALVIYDAATFEEVKRIPMNKPVGKYNVFNKITYSRGTSH